MSSHELEKVEEIPTVIRSAGSMAIGTLVSRVLGFVRDAVFLGLFDRSYTDAFSVAFRLPNLFRRLLGEGLMGVAFIPVLARAGRPKILVDAFFSVLLCGTMCLVGLGVVFMPWIVGLLLGRPDDLVVALGRVMMGFLSLVSLSAFYTALANTRGYFFWPALAPAIFNLGSILFFVIAVGEPDVRMLPAYGVLFGGVLQLLCVGIVLWREGCLPAWSWKWWDSGVQRVLLGMGPGLLGVGLFQGLLLINTRLAGQLGEGSQSYLYAADRILELPQSLVAVAVGSALLPMISKYVVNNDWEKIWAEKSRSTAVTLFFILPASVGLYYLGHPIVSSLFERGSFSADDARIVGQLVSAYSALLLFSSLSRISISYFYAIRRPWVPGLVAVFIIVVHIFTALYLRETLGIKGLAIALSISAFCNWICLQAFAIQYLSTVRPSAMISKAVRGLPSLIAVALVAKYLYPTIEPHVGVSGSTVITISVAIMSYFGVSLFFKVEEAHAIVKKFR